jgi:hypothetical protein
VNGVKGRQVTGPNGNSIFIPAAGGFGSSLGSAGVRGYYWTSSLGMSSMDGSILYFGSGSFKRSSLYRDSGYPIRPVYGEYGWVSLSQDTLGPSDDYDDGYGMKVLRNRFYVKKLRIDTSNSDYSIFGICMVFGSDDGSHFAAFWNQYGKELVYSFSPENHEGVIVDGIVDYGTPVSDNVIEIDFTKYSDKVYIWGYQQNVLLSSMLAYGEFAD